MVWQVDHGYYHHNLAYMAMGLKDWPEYRISQLQKEKYYQITGITRDAEGRPDEITIHMKNINGSHNILESFRYNEKGLLTTWSIDFGGPRHRGLHNEFEYYENAN